MDFLALDSKIIERCTISSDVQSQFINNNVALKITSLTQKKCGATIKDVYMVIDYEDYSRKIKSHKYISLLYITPIELRLAYLYDCLNRLYNKKRNNTFTFWWRKIGTDDWNMWFVVHPYLEENK